MLPVALYVCIFALTFSICSVLILIAKPPFGTKAQHTHEIAPDAKYDVRIQKSIAIAASTIGLASAIINAYFTNRSHRHAHWAIEIAWLNVALWAYLAVLTTIFVLSHRFNVSFIIICHIAALSVLKFALSLVLLSDIIQPLALRAVSIGKILQQPKVLLAILGSLSAFALFTSSLLVPRAPALEYKDRPVVSIAYGTLWDQMLFLFTDKAQSISRAKQSIEQSDLDMMPFNFRASNVLSSFAETRRGYSLLRRLWIAFKIPLTLQFGMAVAFGFLSYVPAFFLLQVLDFIQNYRTQDDGRSIYTGFGYAAGMFAFTQINAVLDSQLWYISAVVLQIRTRAALNLEIYDKTLRKENTSGQNDFDAEKEKSKDNETDDDRKKEEEEKDSLASSKQNVLNLMAVDADRISTFFTFCFFGINSPIEIIVSVVFLYKLLSWAALVGFGVMCLFVPITTLTSKFYSKTQDKLMAVRDRRVGLINEIIQGIRQIKFQSNERYFAKKAQDVRNQELWQLSLSYYGYIAIDFSYALAPVAITVVTFGVYAVYIAPLTPSIAFTALVIMNRMRFSLNFIPEIVVEAITTWTSIKRVQKYLNSDEVEDFVEENTSTASASRPIVLEDASIVFAGSKNDSEAFHLEHITAEFPVGELSLITGATGSGKTLLLNGILGEACIPSGKVDMPRSVSQSTNLTFIPAERWIQPNTIAYVAQTAWLENKTIQQNILFGAPLVDARYQETLFACGLSADLKILEDGDQTEIGEKGINLSGGQKARVSLARAVYSRASVVIMDDVLSALDAHVAKHVFDRCINGNLLKGRTRILVTHQISLCLKAASYVVALENGTMKHVGLVSDLKRTGSLEDLVEEATEPDIQTKTDAKEEAVLDGVKGEVKKPRVLVEEESKFKGTVKRKIYGRYIRAQGSIFYTLFIVALFVFELALTTLATYWLRLWSSKGGDSEVLTIFKSPSYSIIHISQGLIDVGDDHPISFWIGIYMLIATMSEVCGLLGTGLVFWGNVYAARNIYNGMLDSIMHAPLRFLDTVPTGRLLNRFSKDAETVDSKMGRNLTYFLKTGMKVFLVLLVCITVQPICLLAAAVLVGIGLWIGSRYTSATRALKRLDSVNRSPMYETFGSTLSGISTIRAYGSSNRFMQGMYEKIDNVTQAQFFNMAVNRWLSIRFDTIGNLYTVAMAIFIISKIDTIDAGLAGFTLSFALELQDSLLFAIRFYAELEQSMNAVERVFEYTDITTEAPHHIADNAPPAAWPTDGSIEFRDLELKYAPELPSVLHGISLKINPHEKIGIIGRTGSGKTTITLALFRFLEAHKGSILIDGLDISKMGLHDLRSRLTIVPQEPTLFQGTLRSNLGEDATDEELRDVLRRVHLTTDPGTATPRSTTNKNVFDDLDHIVTEHGSNFSAGQRQLLCLARALLRRTKIIIMDEATASVDVETDAIIQRTIRSEFIDSTVLTIAHRLGTIIDYDRILVLDHGNILEFDTPDTLLANSESMFSKMVKAANLKK